MERNERILRERMLLAIVVMHAMIIESGKDKLKLPPNWSFFEKLNLLTKKKDGRDYKQRFYKSLGSNAGQRIVGKHSTRVNETLKGRLQQSRVTA